MMLEKYSSNVPRYKVKVQYLTTTLLPVQSKEMYNCISNKLHVLCYGRALPQWESTFNRVLLMVPSLWQVM